uniref:AAA family ATPase n=1 Tax=Escherichia coli TaxID=562 RepID=UPI0022E0B570
DLITNILHYASYILNKPYTSFNQHQQPNGKILIGVESGGLAYSSLSMSAGEQKIFLILETILKADKNALILIDELDLLLHDEALKKLIEVISSHAKDKNKQIIFTTHREMITTLSDKINIRHVVNIQGRSYSFEETKPDAINRLTGESTTPIEIYVEDDLAVAIINKICSSLKASKYVKIFKFGAASNAFTLLASTLIRGDNLSGKLYILDGDKYSTENEKKTALDKVFTGTEEQYIHYLITNVPLDGLGGEYLEIIEAARDIRVELDAHNYISNILTKLGIDRPSGLTRVMDLASRHPEWHQYVSEVTDWLQPVVSDLMERLPENDTVDIT